MLCSFKAHAFGFYSSGCGYMQISIEIGQPLPAMLLSERCWPMSRAWDEHLLLLYILFLEVEILSLNL